MIEPKISSHFEDRQPSSIRQAQIKFSERNDKEKTKVINLAIGNVSLPIHPSMKKRLENLKLDESFSSGKVPYTSTVGLIETRKAFLNVLAALEIDTSQLFVNITDGGSSSMEIMMLGVCGPSSDRPIMLLDPSYTNYLEFAKRLRIPVVTVEREINNDGTFAPLDFRKIEDNIKLHRPSGLVIIPYDNPTGQFFDQSTVNRIAEICIEHGVWLISDEAYRPLMYTNDPPSSIWKVSLKNIPDNYHYRISIESASKVWNACGLRIGGIITDSYEFHKKAVSEYTANLCANTIGQYVFGALANETHDEIQNWFSRQTLYYKNLFHLIKDSLMKELPGIIVSEPEASIYCVIDFKNISKSDFDSEVFVNYCAEKGAVKIDGVCYTVLLAPMKGFYKNHHIGKTQVRLALVENSELLKITPIIITSLFKTFSSM